MGVHPRFLRHPVDDGLVNLFWALAVSYPKVLAIGEVGLDSQGAEPVLQQQALVAMLRLALELDFPVVLHSVGQDEELLAIITREKVARVGLIWHYFTGDELLAQRCLNLGIYLSLGKPLLREPGLQQVIKGVPLESLLIETDSYPAPGRTTEPRDVRLVAERVAEVKGVTVEQVAQTTTESLKRLLFRRR